jgi:hypothetical protein
MLQGRVGAIQCESYAYALRGVWVTQMVAEFQAGLLFCSKVCSMLPIVLAQASGTGSVYQKHDEEAWIETHCLNVALNSDG